MNRKVKQKLVMIHGPSIVHVYSHLNQSKMKKKIPEYTLLHEKL